MTKQTVKFTPTIDRNTPLPDIGTEILSGDRFHSKDFMDKEWTHLWRKVWSMGPRLEELTAVGDYVIHSLGKESFIFVMDKDKTIRGFYNICQHRGKKLVCDGRQGNAQFFKQRIWLLSKRWV